MSEEGKAFLVGVATGSAVVLVAAYVAAPGVAERVARNAILRLSERLPVVPPALLQAAANEVGPIVREETRKALLP